MSNQIDIEAINASIKSVGDELADELKKHTEEVEKYGKATTDLTGNVDELSAKYKSLQDEIAEIAQRQQGLQPQYERAKSAGEQFIASDAFKSLASRTRSAVGFVVKTPAITAALPLCLATTQPPSRCSAPA